MNNYVMSIVIGCKYQNVIISGMYRSHNIQKIINPDTSRSQFIFIHFNKKHPVQVVSFRKVILL